MIDPKRLRAEQRHRTYPTRLITTTLILLFLYVVICGVLILKGLS